MYIFPISILVCPGIQVSCGTLETLCGYQESHIKLNIPGKLSIGITNQASILHIQHTTQQITIIL